MPATSRTWNRCLDLSAPHQAPGWQRLRRRAFAVDGGDCLSDMALLHHHFEVFGPAASNATAWRAVRRTTSVELARPTRAVAVARAVAWKDRPAGESIVINFDATLVTSHAENKEDAAATYKRGFGFPPAGSVVRDHARAARRHAAAGLRQVRTTQRTTSSCSRRWSQHCALLPGGPSARRRPGRRRAPHTFD